MNSARGCLKPERERLRAKREQIIAVSDGRKKRFAVEQIKNDSRSEHMAHVRTHFVECHPLRSWTTTTVWLFSRSSTIFLPVRFDNNAIAFRSPETKCQKRTTVLRKTHTRTQEKRRRSILDQQNQMNCSNYQHKNTCQRWNVLPFVTRTHTQMTRCCGNATKGQSNHVTSH